MKVSNKCIELVKKYEGCKLKAYKCPAGVWTIGYGTTSADKSITGKNITQGMTITQATANDWLEKSLNKKYLPKVMKYDKTYKWTQNQVDALVSFAYNIGSIDGLTANGTRGIETISNKILEYKKANGRVLTGLVNRRKEEKALFDSKNYFARYTGKSLSVVSALNSLKIDSSYAYRKKIALANGIYNYKGSATQNLKMLNLLKSGKLIRP